MDLTLLHSPIRIGVAVCLLLFAASWAGGDEATALPVLPSTATDDLLAKDGQKAIVYGETAGSGKSESGTHFVNFKGAQFFLIAFASDLGPFGENPPVEAYDGKRIVVTGVVSIYRGKPQIKLTGPEQVRILEEGEAFPAAPAVPETAAPESAKKAEDGKAEKEATGEPEKPAPKPPVDPKLYFR